MTSQNKTKSPNRATPIKHHRVRTTFAAFFGTIALCLILASILVVWLNQTLTNTQTYLSTVGPLVTKPAIQNFIAQKATDQIIRNSPIQDVANTLLDDKITAERTPSQLEALVRPVIRDSILQAMKSPQFVASWKDTNRSVQQELISQLNANASKITLNFTPLVNTVITQLKQTKLSPVASKIGIKSDTANVTLKDDVIKKAHTFYRLFKAGTIVLVLITLLMIGLCVLISVHHLKTLRRIVFSTGILSLILAAILQLPAVVKLGGSDPLQQQAALAIASTLTHNLQLATLALGIVCLLIAIGSKLYSKAQA